MPEPGDELEQLRADHARRAAEPVVLSARDKERLAAARSWAHEPGDQVSHDVAAHHIAELMAVIARLTYEMPAEFPAEEIAQQPGEAAQGV